MNKYNQLFSNAQNPHGHNEFYKLSLDEYDQETNTYLNLYSQKTHQAYGYYPYNASGFMSSQINSQTYSYASFVGSEFGINNNTSYASGIAYREMRGLKYFFIYERQAKELPAPTAEEYVLDGYRYYYQPAQNVTLTYPASTGTYGIYYAATTQAFVCKAGWYSISTPIIFPTDKVGYDPNADPYVTGSSLKSLGSNTYSNGSATWIYSQGQWLRYNASDPLTQAASFTNVLKYVNKGGYREFYYGTPVVNYDLIPIETYNSEQLLFNFGPSDINISDNTITISESAGKFLRTGMLLTFVIDSYLPNAVWPLIGENYKWPAYSIQSYTSTVRNPNSPNSRPAYFESYDSNLTSCYIEKISNTKIKIFPNYNERIVFGQNQKPSRTNQLAQRWDYGFYNQPYFDNQQNGSTGSFLSVGSNYSINVYRLVENYPDGTALLPVEIEGLYPHYQTIKTKAVDFGVMFWSWLDSRYVDLQQNRIKCSLFALPNYDSLVKDYSTGTKITVRVASQIFPMANVARAKYAFSENIPTLSGEQTIQGVKVLNGDYVLLLGQTNTTQNHLYYVSTGTWYKTTPNNDSYMNTATLDVAEYYYQHAIVGVDVSFVNEKKYTVYKARFTYTSMQTQTYVTGWEKQDHDGSLETPYIKPSYYGFTPRYNIGEYPISPNSFELKGFSELPKPLIENGTYYLIKNGEYVSFAESYNDAINNVAIDLESTGKGILVINTAPKTNSGYLEKIVSQNPEIVESLDDKAVYLINKKGGSFQLAGSKENALAKIPMNVKIRPNDYFALVKSENISQPYASIFTRDQKYFSWDVDNINNKQFQRPVPKYLGQDTCDVAAILSSDLTIGHSNFTLTTFEKTYPLTSDSPSSIDYFGYGYYYYNYNYNGSPYNAYGSGGVAFTSYGVFYYNQNSLDYLIYLNGTSREIITGVQDTRYYPPKQTQFGTIYQERTYTRQTLPYNFPAPPPTVTTITKLGLSSSSSWTVERAFTNEQKQFQTFSLNNGTDINPEVYYRKYTTTNVQEIVDAIADDIWSSITPTSIKFLKFTSTKSTAYVDAFGDSPNDWFTQSEVSEGISYYASSNITRTYSTTVQRHKATIIAEVWENSLANFVPPNNYNGLVFDDKLISQGTVTYEALPIQKSQITASSSYIVKIFSGVNQVFSSGVDVGIPGRYTTKKYPEPLQYSKATISAGLSINPSTHSVVGQLLPQKLYYTVTVNYTFNGTAFVKDASDSVYSGLFPSSFAIDTEEYYFPRTSLKLDFTNTVKHIWKKSFMTIVDPPRYSYGPYTAMYFDPPLNSKNITAADYEESSSDVSGPIVLNWNPSQKRYQSTALNSKGVKFRCEALIGRIMKDKQINNNVGYYGSSNVAPIYQETGPYSQDFFTIALFGSPNTWLEFTGIRRLKNNSTLTGVTDSYSDNKSTIQLEPLKLSMAVAESNTKANPSGLTHPIFNQFNISYVFQPFVNNGYELAITDIPLNRHPCWDGSFDMDLQNRWNTSANNRWDAIYGSGILREVTLKNYISGFLTPSSAMNGMTPFNTYGSNNPITMFSVPTFEIVSATGSGGEVSFPVIPNYTLAGDIGSYNFSPYYAWKIISSGKNYVAYSGNTATADYVKITVIPAVFTYAANGYTVIGTSAGSPKIYYSWLSTATSPTQMTSSALYPYASLGIDGESRTPHISAPVTIGLIKKISFE